MAGVAPLNKIDLCNHPVVVSLGVAPEIVDSSPKHKGNFQPLNSCGDENPRFNLRSSFARAHGMRTYEPRQGRKAATAVCSASAVVTLAFSIYDRRARWRQS